MSTQVRIMSRHSTALWLAVVSPLGSNIKSSNRADFYIFDLASARNFPILLPHPPCPHTQMHKNQWHDTAWYWWGSRGSHLLSSPPATLDSSWGPGCSPSLRISGEASPLPCPQHTHSKCAQSRLLPSAPPSVPNHSCLPAKPPQDQ